MLHVQKKLLSPAYPVAKLSTRSHQTSRQRQGPQLEGHPQEGGHLISIINSLGYKVLMSATICHLLALLIEYLYISPSRPVCDLRLRLWEAELKVDESDKAKGGSRMTE